MSSSEKIIIETPEQTSLEYPLAGLGSRFLAIATDTLIQFLVVAAASLVVTLAVSAAALRSFGMKYGAEWILAMLILISFLVNFAYFAVFEAVWNGQTPGKRFARIRVMKDDGRPIGVFDSVARNLLRIVDSLPAMYVVGIISILFSGRNKRLGDYVAGTVVVHEKTLEAIRPYLADGASTGASAIDVSRLSADEVKLIEAYLGRCESLDPAVRASMAQKIASHIGNTVRVEARGWPQTEKFLADVLGQFRSTGRLRSH